MNKRDRIDIEDKVRQVTYLNFGNWLP